MGPKWMEEFAAPPAVYGMMPFWFWNDELEDGEILAQIRAFHARGLGGFIPHARVGLSRRVGYLTPEYFRLLRLAVEEAGRLGMKVVLYDEGSYPSGSAQGRVAAEDPHYAAKCLFHVEKEVAGPASGYWRPNSGRALADRLLAVVRARETAPGVLDPDSLESLPVLPNGLVAFDVPGGAWRLYAMFQGYSGGRIRGVFEEEEDGHALAPAAGDLLDPRAVQCFIRQTHERFFQELAPHFGRTIIAMFTDEPHPLGRGPYRTRQPVPFTDGFLDHLQEYWPEPVQCWLPALWADCGPRTELFRRQYERAVGELLARTFYAAQERWCREHGIALTGHPASSDEIRPLSLFHWPGQDMVWRWVLPGTPAALEGRHSVAPRAAASAAILKGAPRSTSEALGAYGWRLTLDEAKWLLDWHLARGNNLQFAHACFYSIRGRRAWESEPDLGVHNAWWPWFGEVAWHVRRACRLLCGGREVLRTGILTDPDRAAWAAAKALHQVQIPFVYVDSEWIAHAEVRDGALRAGDLALDTVVVDEPGPLPPDVEARLAALDAGGGTVLREWAPDELGTAVRAKAGPDLDWPGAPDLRVLHYLNEGVHVYLLVNEGEEAIEGPLSTAVVGAASLLDPMDGSIRPWPARPVNGRMRTVLRIERRQALALAVDPATLPSPDLPTLSVPGEAIAPLDARWTARDAAGRPLNIPCPGDWSRAPGWELFTGTVVLAGEFSPAPGIAARACFLDLGRVGDIAEVTLNGRLLGVRCWAPYVFALPPGTLRESNQVEVRVTNSMANAYEGLQMPSGLMGPARLVAGRPLGRA